ncbi:GPP34 family phosphoprotein [Glutamicibacter arilaitensis]|uniref:GOLPH3/VPS74 family protein n=1 Tax=Glutamicibacter arilaitensis TaxID=256701 RepID=UPI00384CCAC4
MLISEMLYLLLTKDDGQPETVMSSYKYGMNSAIIADLILAGRIGLTDDPNPRITIIGAGPIADPVLEHPLEKLEGKNGINLDSAVAISGLCNIRLVTDSLAKQGLVEYGERGLLGLGKAPVRVLNGQLERQFRSGLSLVLQGQREAATHEATLLSIIHGMGVLQQVLPEEIEPIGIAQAQARIREVAIDARAGDAVRKAVATMNEAVATTTILPGAN